MRDDSLALDLFLERADKISQRVAGTAVFLSARSDVVPDALLHSLKHYKVLHERVVLATVTAADTPFVPSATPHRGGKAGQGLFHRPALSMAFSKPPTFPKALALARAHGLALEMDSATYFLGRETLVPGEHPSLQRWRVALYMWLASNALSPARFYHLPPGRVVELGTQVTI